MAKKINTVGLEMAREVLKRKMDRPRDDNHYSRMLMVLEVIIRAISDLSLEDSEKSADQLEGRGARLFLFGNEGKATFEALGIEPNFGWSVALKVGDSYQDIEFDSEEVEDFD